MSTRMPCLGSGAPRSLRSPPWGVTKPVFAVLLLCAAALDAVQASMPTPGHPISHAIPRIEDPDYLVQRYLEAVDRGELVIFGQTLARSMIVPARVEYAYELSSRTTRIRVYSNLKESLPVPGQSDCRILSVGAVMEDGHITEIESHIWMKQ